jgi:hypothetical protein
MRERRSSEVGLLHRRPELEGPEIERRDGLRRGVDLLNKWMPEERLLGHQRLGFDVSGFCLPDVLGGLKGAGLSPRSTAA